MCDSGRYESLRSSVPASRTRPSESHVHVMLRWVSIAPFGGPVVPDVYTSVARSSDFTACACSSKSAGPAANVSFIVGPRDRLPGIVALHPERDCIGSGFGPLEEHVDDGVGHLFLPVAVEISVCLFIRCGCARAQRSAAETAQRAG